MGRSRASKEQMRGHHDGVMPRKCRYKGGCMVESESHGGDVDHWMQDVHPKKGALHKALHISGSKKIPTSLLEKEKHARSPLMRKRATLALNYRGA